MNLKKTLYIIVGFISLGIGAIGAVLPMLPSFPFLLFAAFCFAKSSAKLHSWFKGTKLYKDHLDSYVQGKGMTWKTRIRIIFMVTLLMAIGFTIMALQNIVVGCIILGCIWLCHIVYFIWGVKTLPSDTELESA